MKSRVARILFPALLLCLLALPLAAQDMSQYMHEFEKHITVKTLPNGLTLLVMERPTAPVFSFFTHVDAGSVQDPKNKSGLAHMFEHMAFKGTTTLAPPTTPRKSSRWPRSRPRTRPMTRNG